MAKIDENGNSASASTSVSVTVNSTSATAVLLMIGGVPLAAVSSVTDSQGGGDNNAAWQIATNTGTTSGGGAIIAACCGTLFTKRGSTHVITVNFTGPLDSKVQAVVFSGPEYTFTPANSKGNQEVGATAIDTGTAGDSAFTPATPNALVFGGVSTSVFWSTSTYSCSNGTLTEYSKTATSGNTEGAPGLMCAFVEQTTPTSINLSFNWTTNARFAGSQVYLEAVSGIQIPWYVVP